MASELQRVDVVPQLDCSATRRRRTLACALAVAAAACVRIAAARSDLWLDEVVSLQIALQIPTPLHAITVLHDNNHLLNTSWLAWLGPERPELLYRLPNVLAGAAIAALGWVLAPCTNPYAKPVTALLLAVSMPLVTHTSEARGYGPAIACVLAAWFILERRLEGARGAWLPALFGSCVVLALLWHVSALMGYAALLAYWLVRRLRRVAPRALAAEALRLHLAPCAAALLLYWFFTRRLKVGDGYEMTPIEALSRAASWTLGLRGDPATDGLALALVVGLSALAVRELRRARDPRWVLYVAGMLLPVLALVAARIPHSAPRYLLFSVTFFLLLLGQAAGVWLERAGISRLACLLLLGASLALNAAGDAELLRFGRGSYRAALSFLLQHGGPGAITVTSDHDFRNGILLAHHARLLRGGDRIAYVPGEDLLGSGADWLILHRNAGDPSEPADHVQVAHHAFDKQLALPCATTSGMSWYLYRRRAVP